jgi:glycosyltransferase involved in cell wall biosynthesis
MRIHSICLVKDESDIIEQTLRAAVEWSDFIYVFDNGSTDGTWEKVLNLSRGLTQVIAYKQEDCVFHDSLRAQVFHHYRSNSQPGDWWCRLDADEIYIDHPRLFLADVPSAYQAVWSASFQYYLTHKDVEIYQHSPESYADEVPIEQKCRYYLNDWSEARFFRDDARLVWDLDEGWSYFGAIYPVRIRLKHYQYRSPPQMQKRLENRLKTETFIHEANRMLESADWSKRIRIETQLDYDAHDQQYMLREHLMPKIPSSPPFIVNRLRYFKKYVRLLRRLLQH